MYMTMNGEYIDHDQMTEDIAMGILEYSIGAHAAIALGPLGTIRHAGSIAAEPTSSKAMDAARIEMGALGITYGYLTLLNYVQGPKYAMDFWTLHQSLNPARNMILRHGGPVGALATMQVELSKTKISNIGMDPIPGVKGAYSNPLGGKSGSDVYYPGKGIIDFIFG